MLSVLISLFLGIIANASNSNLKIEKAFKVDDKTKFMVIRSGDVSAETISQMEEKSTYCAIENYKMHSLKFKAGQNIKASIKKISFPNQSIQRFSVASNSNYAIFCDFTGKADFDESKVIVEINSQLIGLMKVSEE